MSLCGFGLMASFGTHINSVTDSVLVEGDVASIQFIRHFRFATPDSMHSSSLL